MTNLEVKVDTKQDGIESAPVFGSFDKAKDALEKQGYRIISLEENARLRIQEGENSDICQSGGNWVREGVLYIPKKGAFLTKNSPIMENPKEACQEYLLPPKRIEWILTAEQVEKALKDSVQIPEEIKSISTDKSGEDPITKYIFGNVAKDYGKFLRKLGIEKMRILTDQEYFNTQDRPVVMPVYFGFNPDSYVDGSTHWCFVNNGNLRGVKEK